MALVTLDEFLEWKQSNVTKLFMKALSKERNLMKEQVVTDMFEPRLEEQVKGRCAAINSIVNMQHEDLIEALQESE